MTEQHIRPLEGDALEALEAERVRPDPALLTKARVRSRLLESLAAPSGVSHGVPSTRAATALARLKIAGTMGAVFVAGGAVGAAMQARLAKPESVRIVEIAAAAAPASAVPALPTQVDIVDSVDAIGSTTPTPSPSAVERQRLPAESDLKAERALLNRAREAFARGDDPGTVTILDLHMQKFPSGRLVEEREALAIKAFVNMGRFDEARRRGDRFRIRFPKSLLLPAVDNALNTNP